MAASMARASTDGLGDAPCAAPRPPPTPCALVVPLAPLSCSIDAVARRTGIGVIFFLSCGVVAEVSSHGDGRIIPPQLFLPDNGIKRQ